VNIHSLQLEDEEGREVNVYNEDSYRVPRRAPKHLRSCPPCGLLLDLTKVHALFQTSFEQEDDNDDDLYNVQEAEPQVKLTVYPQAFTKRYGHLQANGPPLGFRDLLKSLNQELVHDEDNVNPPIKIVAFQGYNHVQHNLAERAGAIEVVQGRITAALAGTHATGRGKNAFKKALSFVQSLPHSNVESKLSKDVMARAMRFEIVVTIDLMALKEEYQCGGFVTSIPAFFWLI
jgi:hypothetical protein